MLIDAAALLSPVREDIASKLALWMDFCREYEMKVNCAKTKFFCCEW